METDPRLALIIACAIVTAGCAGIDRQQTETTASTVGSKLIIEDDYPQPFSVVVRDAEDDEVLLDESFSSADHGRVDLSSSVPSDRPVTATIVSDETTLWSERVEPYEGYLLEIRADGTVDPVLFEA